MRNAAPLELFHEWVGGTEVALAPATPDGRTSLRVVPRRGGGEPVAEVGLCLKYEIKDMETRLVAIAIGLIAVAPVLLDAGRRGSQSRPEESVRPLDGLLIGLALPSGKHAPAAASITAAGDKEVVLTRRSTGHFLTDAQVNGHGPVEFVADTGPSTVALPTHPPTPLAA